MREPSNAEETEAENTGSAREPELGDIIYDAIRENLHIESAPWAVDRVDRIMKRFGEARGKHDEFIVVIPWMEECTAFTAPGRYIFFSRNLFQLCDSDDMAAMVIAHEMSHHDLGHTKIFQRWAAKLGFDFKVWSFALYRMIVKRTYGPEQEGDADRNALELCLKAGYDGKKCIGAFDIIEKHVLDMRDIEGAYGPDEMDDPLEEMSWKTRMRIWLSIRGRGYFPVRERKNMLLRHLKKIAP